MASKYAGPAASAPQPAQNDDPTQVSGQDPKELFGLGISYESGAAGSAGAGGAADQDSTNQPNQYPGTEPISGVALGGTGAPGSAGVGTDRPGTQAVTVTDPNYTAGKPGGGSGIQPVTVPVAVGGPGDSTATPGNYPPVHPLLPGGPAMPTSTGAGAGKVRVGGNMNGKRG